MLASWMKAEPDLSGRAAEILPLYMGLPRSIQVLGYWAGVSSLVLTPMDVATAVKGTAASLILNTSAMALALSGVNLVNSALLASTTSVDTLNNTSAVARPFSALRRLMRSPEPPLISSTLMLVAFSNAGTTRSTRSCGAAV